MACNSLDKIGLSSGMVSETKRPYELGGFVGGITPSHASYKVLTKFLPTQAVGWYNRRMVKNL
jgi:hypothetical protein